MAAKKKKAAKKAPAKREKKAAKPKKAARQAATKTPKAPRKKRSGAPTSGQSGPSLDLAKDKLNDKEQKIVATLLGDANPMPINALATTCFSDQTQSKANSWVRNSLRRLVRGKWVEKVGKGTYRVTDQGKARFEGAEAPSEAPTSEPETESEPAAEQPTA